MTLRRRLAVLAGLPVAVAVMATAAGCAALGVQSESCVEWVWFDSPDAAAADADLVVLASGPTEPAGTVQLFGTRSNAHSVEVVDVLKGDATLTGDLTVAATPVTCTGGTAYPDGDPLDTAGPLVLFLSWDADAEIWRTITPGQGVVAATAEGTIPDSWPTT